MKMEAICSSKTSADTQRTTRRHISQDSTLVTLSVLEKTHAHMDINRKHLYFVTLMYICNAESNSC
jgi:hypothetical protein